MRLNCRTPLRTAAANTSKPAVYNLLQPQTVEALRFFCYRFVPQ